MLAASRDFPMQLARGTAGCAYTIARHARRHTSSAVHGMAFRRAAALPRALVIRCLLALLVGAAVLSAFAGSRRANRHDEPAVAAAGGEMLLCAFNRQFVFSGPPAPPARIRRPPSTLKIDSCSAR
jgi:hypothetical protein